MTALQAKIAATVTQVVEVQLKPSLKRKLLNELSTYADLHAQVKSLEASMDAHKATIEQCLIESGEERLEIDGYRTTMVFAQRSKLDKKLFVQQGGTLAQLENATVTAPAKPYLKVTLPGQKERTYEE